MRKHCLPRQVQALLDNALASAFDHVLGTGPTGPKRVTTSFSRHIACAAACSPASSWLVQPIPSVATLSAARSASALSADVPLSAISASFF